MQGMVLALRTTSGGDNWQQAAHQSHANTNYQPQHRTTLESAPPPPPHMCRCVHVHVCVQDVQGEEAHVVWDVGHNDCDVGRWLRTHHRHANAAIPACMHARRAKGRGAKEASARRQEMSCLHHAYHGIGQPCSGTNVPAPAPLSSLSSSPPPPSPRPPEVPPPLLHAYVCTLCSGRCASLHARLTG